MSTYDRAVSAFAYLQGIGIIDPKIKFTSFCTDVLRQQGTPFNPHFDPQSDGLFCNGDLIPQFLARFESIRGDWIKITSAIDGPRSLPHINQSRRRRSYADYYDESAREVITNLYADDLTNFNYRFEK